MSAQSSGCGQELINAIKVPLQLAVTDGLFNTFVGFRIRSLRLFCESDFVFQAHPDVDGGSRLTVPLAQTGPHRLRRAHRRRAHHRGIVVVFLLLSAPCVTARFSCEA